MSVFRVYVCQIYDSRGNPTVEVDLTTEYGMFYSLRNMWIYMKFMCFDKISMFHVLFCIIVEVIKD